MDPTHTSHPKSSTTTTTTTTTTKPHSKHPSDPTIASSTINTISSRFSSLYANHKAIASKSLNPSSKEPPPPDTHLQEKPVPTSPAEDSSTAGVEKQSIRVRARKARERQSKPTKGSHGDERFLRRESERKETHEGNGVKKSSLSPPPPPPGAEERELGVSHDGVDLKRPSLSLAMSGGRRRSFWSSKTELAGFFNCNGVKVVSADMPPFMQVHAVDFARKTYDSLEKFTSKTLASNLKKEFDGVYGPAWHCIVGTSFGSFVTHSVGGFLYFSMDHKLYVLLFKTSVQRAD